MLLAAKMLAILIVRAVSESTSTALLQGGDVTCKTRCNATGKDTSNSVIDILITIYRNAARPQLSDTASTSALHRSPHTALDGSFSSSQQAAVA